jgi:hypothetical protein
MMNSGIRNTTAGNMLRNKTAKNKNLLPGKRKREKA